MQEVMDAEKYDFQTEVSQLLDLMVNSLYSHKEIFLRELISNASDALDKLRFEQLTNESLRSEVDPEIRIEVDKEARTLTISDNGIGMTRAEVIENIGTIARSGTKEFIARAKEKGESNLPPELIGQFGVGFYSSFMVSDRVELTTRKAGTEEAITWNSAGDGTFTLTPTTREQSGTTITLFLKDVDKENGIDDFTDDYTIRSTVKKYSDFVAYPIRMNVWKDKGETGAKVMEEQTLNSMKAIWARNKDEVTEEEYNEFYKHIAHDWTDPLAHIPIKIEGTFEANALLFIPGRAPYDLYRPEMRRGIQLYVKRVFIMDECKELLPTWLRFVKGVVDAQDLSLNVSREILQQDRQLKVIRKQLIKKVLDTLHTMKDEDQENFATVRKEFSTVLKEGLIPFDVQDKDRIFDLLEYPSTNSDEEKTSLSDYVSRMKEGQEAIYYLSGMHPDDARKSPHLEAYKARGYEVILMPDPVDELWLDRSVKYRDFGFRSVGTGEVPAGTDEEKQERKEKLEKQTKEFEALIQSMSRHLEGQIKNVALSSLLTDSPACLTSDEAGMSPGLRNVMREDKDESPYKRHTLELNGEHPLIQRLRDLQAENADNPVLAEFSRLLFGQAILAEAGKLPNPSEYSRLVTELMVKAA